MNLTVVLVNYKCDKAKLQSCINSIKINTDVLIVDHSHDFTFDNITIPLNLNIKVIKNIKSVFPRINYNSIKYSFLSRSKNTSLLFPLIKITD